MNGAQEALEEALCRVEANAPADWKNSAEALLSALAASGIPFTADDIWKTLPQPPEPRALGAIIRAAARDGRIRRMGFMQSVRACCHQRLVAVWVGV